MKEEEINPENHWEEASGMLDNHFRKRRRRFAFLLLMLLLSGTAGIYILNRSSNEVAIEGSEKPASGIKGDNIIPSEDPIIEKKDNKDNANFTDKVKQENNVNPRVENQSPIINHTVSSQNINNSLHADDHILQDNSVKDQVDVKTEFSESVSTQEFPDKYSVGSIEFNENIHLIERLDIPVIKFNGEVTGDPDNKKTKKALYGLYIYGGGALVSQEIKGMPESYIIRRSQEESNAWVPGAGIQLSRSIGDVDIRAGFEFTATGSDVSYSPYSRGEYTQEVSEWQPYQYTVTDTDSTYIFGMLFMHTQSITKTDSTLVSRLDTLNGLHYDERILEANGKTRNYLVEIPLTVTYQISRSRFGFGIRAGVAPGVHVKSTGYYLVNDESEVIANKKENRTSLTLNLQAGAEFSYLASDRFRIVLSPVMKYYPIGQQEDRGGSATYRSAGVNMGLFYLLKK